jgi:NADPH:quinone reductase-like Zn-dependent oxidoreductase
MKAIVHDTYGLADVLELRDIDKPQIADDEVLVRVHAAGVDRGVWHLMTGLPYPIRLAGYGLRKPKTPVPGMDMAGVVEAVGNHVTRFQPGDEVFGIGKGAFAEYAARPRTSWRPSRPTSPSNRRRWSPSPACRPCKPCATTGAWSRARRC